MNKKERREFVVITLIIISCLFILLSYVTSFHYDDCYSEYSYECIITGIKNQYHLRTNRGDFYVSEGIPGNIEQYFNESVIIYGGTGCGRCSIHEIKIIK